MNTTETIRVELQEGLAVLTMAQPARGNPIDGNFTRDFKQVALDLWNCTSLRAVLLRADGANYSVGGGIVDQIVADNKLQDEALALATRLAHGPTLAYGEIKRLFLRAGMAQLEAQLEDEALTLARVAGSRDAQEGIAAQIEKRKSVFQGR